MRSTNTGTGDTGRDPSAWDELKFGCGVLLMYGMFPAMIAIIFIAWCL